MMEEQMPPRIVSLGKENFLSLHLWNRHILDMTTLGMIILPGFLFMIVNHKLRNQEQRKVVKITSYILMVQRFTLSISVTNNS